MGVEKMMPLTVILLLLLGLLIPAPQIAAAASAQPAAQAACAPPALPMRSINQILAPRAVDSASVSAWLTEMRQMRVNCQREIGFNGSMSKVNSVRLLSE